MKNLSRINEIHNIIINLTTNAITSRTYDFSKCNAYDISIIFHLDRSNTSRYLNQLYLENKLIKIQGRPTLYLDSDTINSFSNLPVPSILPVGKDIKDYLIGKYEKKALAINNLDLIEYDYAGISIFESLYQINNQIFSTIKYPLSIQTVTIKSDFGNGVSHYLKYVYQTLKQEGKVSTNSFHLQAINSDIINNLPAFINSLKDKSFIILNVIDLSEMDLLIFHNKLMDFFSSFTNQELKKNPILIFYRFIKQDYNKFNHFISKYSDLRIQFPEYKNRTIKERVEIILNEFQNQSDLLNETICFDKNILSCFCTSEMSDNLNDLIYEIKNSIKVSYFNYLNNHGKIIRITLDELSDNLLNGIHDITNYLDQINSIWTLLETDMIYFIPHSNNQFETKLLKSKLNNRFLIEDINTSLIITTSQSMLNEVGKTKLNSIHSIYVKEVYDIVYPILSKTVLENDNQTMIVLFEFIQNTIDDIQNENYIKKDANYSVPCNKLSTQLTKMIIELLQKKTGIELPLFEQKVINTFLYMSLEKHTNQLPIFVLCYGEDVATNYVNYVKKIELYDNITAIDYTKQMRDYNFQYFVDYVCELIDKMEFNDHILLFADASPLTGIGDYISKRLNIHVETITPLSLPLLINSIQKLKNSNDNTSILYTNNPLTSAINLNDYLTDSSQIIINKITNDILEQSLIFLSPKKAATLLSNVLLEILKELHLNYCDEIAIRFIIHGAFVIERAIKNEPLINKKTKEILKNHSDIFNIIKNNFSLINNSFNTNIADSEIATCTEIFVNTFYS